MEILIVIVLLVVAVIIRAAYENTHYTIEYKDIYDKKINKDTKVVFFSDLHNVDFGNNNEKLLKDIDTFNPELIVIAGDLYVSKKNEKNENAHYILEQLCNKYKVIFTFGNHETKLKNKEKYNFDIDSIFAHSKNDNLILLNNDSYNVVINDNRFAFKGYEIPLSFYKKFDKESMSVEDITEMVGVNKSDSGEITMLIAHNPNYFETYAEYGADYVFSGHNHGGIVRIPVLGGVISTGFRLFPKYYAGEFVKGRTKMFVSRGLGSHTIKFRLFNLPEIHMFTFKSID